MKQSTPLLALLATPLIIYGISQLGPLSRKMEWRSDMSAHRSHVTQYLKKLGASSAQINEVLGPFPEPPQDLSEIQFGKNLDSALGIESSPPTILYSLPCEPVDYSRGSDGFFFIGMSTPSDISEKPEVYSSARALEDFAGILRNSYGVSDRNMILLQGPSKGDGKISGRGIDAEFSKETLDEMVSTLETGAFGNNPIQPNSRVMMALFNDGTYPRPEYYSGIEYFLRDNFTKLIQTLPAQSFVFLEAVSSNSPVYSDRLFANQKPNKNVLCIVPPNKDVIVNREGKPPAEDNLKLFTSALKEALKYPHMDFADTLGYLPGELSPTAFYYSPKGTYASNGPHSVSRYHSSPSFMMKEREIYPIIDSTLLSAPIGRFIRGDVLNAERAEY